MKIIAKGNYDSENRSDFLIATGLNEHYASLIARLLNAHEPEGAEYFYVAVEDDYVLYEWKP